jgi:hypothetical protein
MFLGDYVLIYIFLKKLKITLQYTADLDETDLKKDAAKYIKAKMIEKSSKLAAMAETTQSTNEVFIRSINISHFLTVN